MDLTCQAWRNARRQDPRDLRNPPAREAGEAVLTLEERLGSMKRGAGRLLVLVLCLVAAGCTTDNIAWLKYRSGLVLTDHRRAQREHAAQMRTAERLLAACRECLAAGWAEDLCRSDLPACRECLDAGGAPESTMSSRFISAWTITTPWVQVIGRWLIGHFVVK